MLFSIIQAAGWPIWPLIACSILALALIIERFMNLSTRKVAPPKLLDEAITVSQRAVPAPGVVAQLAQNSALGEVLASGMRALLDSDGGAKPVMRTLGSPSLRSARSASALRPRRASQRGDSGKSSRTSGSSRSGIAPKPNNQRQPRCGMTHVLDVEAAP